MQTASQIMAAKKQAKAAHKIARQAKQQIGTGTVQGDRNRRAIIERNQHARRRKLQQGAPCGRDANVTDAIRNLLAYGDLVYRHDDHAATVYEKLIRAMRCVAAIWADYNLSAACNDAQSALEQSQAKQDLSPNQRRVLLRPLLILAQYSEAYGEICPEQTAIIIAGYCAAVQVALYTTALYDRPIWHVEAMNAVIRGGSIRTLAKRYGVKETELRQAVLDAAWCLYRIAECYDPSPQQAAESIPSLREQQWRQWGSPDHVQSQIRRMTETWLIPFENSTGVTLIDYHQFRGSLVEIEAAAAA